LDAHNNQGRRSQGRRRELSQNWELCRLLEQRGKQTRAPPSGTKTSANEELISSRHVELIVRCETREKFNSALQPLVAVGGYKIVIVQMRIGAIHPINFLALPATQRLVFVQAPDAFK